MEDLLQVGVITSPHGIKGAVKIFPTTDRPEHFKKLKSVYMEDGTELHIQQVQFFKQFVIIKFQELDSMNDAEGYKKVSLYIPKKEAAPLKDNEYFIGDLIGMKVSTEDGQVLGDIKDVLLTGANDVYVVQREDNGEELLIPAIKQCILNVNVSEKKMQVHLLKGLLDL